MFHEGLGPSSAGPASVSLFMCVYDSTGVSSRGGNRNGSNGGINCTLSWQAGPARMGQGYSDTRVGYFGGRTATSLDTFFILMGPSFSFWYGGLSVPGLLWKAHDTAMLPECCMGKAYGLVVLLGYSYSTVQYIVRPVCRCVAPDFIQDQLCKAG
jgi:hypothetical protein